MELDEFRRVLDEAASGAVRDTTAARAAVGARARRQRVQRRSLVSIVAVVAAAAIVLAVLTLPNNPHHEIVSVTPTSTTTGHTEPAVAVASAAQLMAGHWEALPPAPIPSRSGASVVWTGHELIVWGGAAGAAANQLRADGAAYDPTTNAWRALPPAPLSPRAGQAAVWTGTEMIVWGGYDDVSLSSFQVVSDGAAYNPGTNTWRDLPPSPLAARHDATAVWTGSRMIVLGGDPAVITDTVGEFRDSASYDPATNQWQTIAPPAPVADHPLEWRAAVQAGPDRLLAWSQWEITKITGPDTQEGSGGADLFALDEATGRWRNVDAAPNAIPSINEVSWNGTRAVVRGLPYNCGNCSPPFTPEVTALYDPAANTWRRLPPDPLDQNDMVSAWTGGALVSFNSESQSGGSTFATVNPGAASVYDPATNRWTRLIDASSGCGDSAQPLWTGHEVLMYCPSETNRTIYASGLAYVPTASTPAPLSCPATSTENRVPARQRAGTAHTIVPSQPIELIGCRYHGLNQPQASGTFVDAAVLPATEIAREINATPILPPGAPMPNCPDGTGERYLLQFAYAAGPTLDVTVTNDGCYYVDNGNLSEPFVPPALVTQLTAALGQDPQP